MGRIKIDYGIDLGTTNSALSRMENGEVVTSEIDQSRIVPSSVYIDQRGRIRVGIQAFNKKNSCLELPSGTINKRNIASSLQMSSAPRHLETGRVTQ